MFYSLFNLLISLLDSFSFPFRSPIILSIFKTICWVGYFNGFVKAWPFKFFNHVHIMLSVERNCQSFSALKIINKKYYRSSCPTHTLEVICRTQWKIIIDNSFQTWKVKPSGTKISRQQNIFLIISKPLIINTSHFLR